MPKGKHKGHASGSSHYRWNKERMLSKEGYTKIRVGIGHRLADPNGYAYEHLIVWASAGYPLPAAGEVIHHRNNDRTDNRIENLEVITRGDHNSHHNAERGRDSLGQFKKRTLDGGMWEEYPKEGKT